MWSLVASAEIETNENEANAFPIILVDRQILTIFWGISLTGSELYGFGGLMGFGGIVSSSISTGISRGFGSEILVPRRIAAVSIVSGIGVVLAPNWTGLAALCFIVWLETQNEGEFVRPLLVSVFSTSICGAFFCFTF